MLVSPTKQQPSWHWYLQQSNDHPDAGISNKVTAILMLVSPTKWRPSWHWYLQQSDGHPDLGISNEVTCQWPSWHWYLQQSNAHPDTGIFTIPYVTHLSPPSSTLYVHPDTSIFIKSFVNDIFKRIAIIQYITQPSSQHRYLQQPILNSFINDIFKCIATEASSMLHIDI